jgi:RNA polymerase sigma-70 factor (ECF subfamily)
MGDDSTLLRLARAGNAAALDELLQRHQNEVLRFGRRMCGNEEEARDVLQETLLTAFRKLGEFRGDARLSTWLYQIARNFCAKGRRRGAGEPAHIEPLEKPEAAAVPAPDAQPDAVAYARQMGAMLQAAMAGLSEAHREVIILRDVEGLSAEQAAKRAGIDVGALKSRLHRARAELRRKLEG